MVSGCVFVQEKARISTQSCFFVVVFFKKRSELTSRLKPLDCIPCFPNLFRMHTWRRRDPEVIWPFSPDSATQPRASTAWKHSQPPSRLLMHRWAFLTRVRKIIRKKKAFDTTKCLLVLCRFTGQPVNMSVAAPWLSANPNRQCWAGGQ